jgi:hypothetical protein
MHSCTFLFVSFSQHTHTNTHTCTHGPLPHFVFNAYVCMCVNVCECVQIMLGHLMVYAEKAELHRLQNPPPPPSVFTAADEALLEQVLWSAAPHNERTFSDRCTITLFTAHNTYPTYPSHTSLSLFHTHTVSLSLSTLSLLSFSHYPNGQATAHYNRLRSISNERKLSEQEQQEAQAHYEEVTVSAVSPLPLLLLLSLSIFSPFPPLVVYM